MESLSHRIVVASCASLAANNCASFSVVRKNESFLASKVVHLQTLRRKNSNVTMLFAKRYFPELDTTAMSSDDRCLSPIILCDL